MPDETPKSLIAEDSLPTQSSEKDVECMGCKAVAFVTPLVVSGYLYSQLGTKKQLETWRFASEWKGNQRWRFHMHRFNMAVIAPIGICFLYYSHLFKFGLFKDVDREQPMSLQEDIKDDLDRFTKGTLSLAYWVRDTYNSKAEKFNDIRERAKRMIDAPTTEPKQNKSDKS